ncbi:MAG: nicotinate-nicotinamide nucleotide adenylyltransferase [Oscillospiraceae bacterium]
MYKKRVRQMLAELTRQLCARPASGYLKMSRGELTELLQRSDASRRLEELLAEEKPLTCARVAAQWEDVMDGLSPAPAEGWLSYTYRFACGTLFPRPEQRQERRRYGAASSLLLALLQVLFDDERRRLPFDFLRDIRLLTEEEYAGEDHGASYARFLRAYRREYVYEMMRLGLEATPFKSMEHIAGVHHVAMCAARDMKRAGFPVDLSLVSAAACGHDIGKFGCRTGERVPYLHYYYTDLWFSRHDLSDIGYIATNHSVWDMELENLSVESLLLIYADFRVKQERDAQGREVTTLYSLQDSFDVILRKLDNVDEAKRTRYTYVYTKLRDFEEYMISLGVDVTLSGKALSPRPRKDIALMDSREVVDALRLMGVEHNLRLMHRLSDQRQFAAILEQARGETDWKRLRAYLNIFASYSVYLRQEQKVQTLNFLYELLMHKEGDIRRQAATLMGDILARFHAGYAKEVPADYVPAADECTALKQWESLLERILHPDHKLMPQHKRWGHYMLKLVAGSLLEKCRDQDREAFWDALLRYYSDPEALDDVTAFTLTETAAALPLESCCPAQREGLLRFASALCGREPLTVRAAALLLLRRLYPLAEDKAALLRAAQRLETGGSASLALLRRQTLDRWCGMEEEKIPQLTDGSLSEIFLENLKTATPWIIKEINIRLLTDFAAAHGGHHLLHIATHLSNLVMVSEQITVRHAAGAALLRIAPILTDDQRNEVSVELTRGLEMDQQEFSKYIPTYLGQFFLWLPPAQLEESIRELQESLGSSNDRVVSAAVSTVGVMYENYESYRSRFPESDESYRGRRERLLGMLLKGLAGFRSGVRQEALLVIGESLFGSPVLSTHEKRRAFALAAKKLLFLIHEDQGGDLTFFYRSATLIRIYRFITDQVITRGGFDFEERRKVAFFPGTFDPFTLSHKGIAQHIRDMGFEVMLAIDEFSWSKKTQPHRIRRQLASISVADEFHVHIFPEDFPVNIANPDNLRRLREAFPGREVYMVVGSDVVSGASAYRAEPAPFSIHSFHHIVFRRELQSAARDYSRITGKVVELSLPPHLEDISSTRIREAIDANRDISNLIDPVAQEYIYLRGLYLREPLDKPVLQMDALGFTRLETLTDETAERLCRARLATPELCALIRRSGDMVLLLHGREQETVLGFAAGSYLDSHALFARLGSTRLSSHIRERAGGRTLLISGIWTARDADAQELAQQLLTEVLTRALHREYTFALFCPLESASPVVEETLRLQGFIPAPFEGAGWRMVDMGSPIVLTRNLETTIKEPLAHAPRVRSAITAAHRRLQRTLAELYPGSLVLSLSAATIHHRLLQRITHYNRVPAAPTTPRVLGEHICVPFGKILRGVAVPNTVTKTLHTDKVYEPDLSSFRIEAYPGYSPLANQARTIRAFDRPVILVDDLLHDGKRARCVVPLLEREGAEIAQVLVGYLTGMGRDVMTQLGYPVEGIYYLPNLRLRFVESTLYPFIGGDTVRRQEPLSGGLQPSVNRIYPYAAPELPEGAFGPAAYTLSRCCLENARDILLTLETEYRALFARNLTLGRLGEAVILPLCPDRGGCMTYDLSRAASDYLESDLQRLTRMAAGASVISNG